MGGGEPTQTMTLVGTAACLNAHDGKSLPLCILAV